ncbi:phage portal protein [Jiella endophytica]|uniref:Phage portal protein n=1 Tax=Jiella endophytica TaxID=2558362 RepID=A0A4Y8RFL5_9HYPH|nr:phage portal protein [Jiella endophytica]
MGLARSIAGWLGAAARPPDAAAAVRESGIEPASSTGPSERKSAATVAGTLVFAGSGEGVWTERSYAALSRSGFMQNPVAYRSVRLISEAAAAIPPVLYDGPDELSEHRLLDLLKRPNPMMDGAAFVEAICGHLLLSGNAYVEASFLDGALRALHLLRPDRIRLIEGGDGWPEAYEYRAGTRVRRIAAEGPGGGPGTLLQLTLFHPLADHEGYPPLGAAQNALDLHNAAARWNRALIDNSARPSGALIYKAEGGGNLSPDQFDRLKAELESDL